MIGASAPAVLAQLTNRFGVLREVPGEHGPRRRTGTRVCRRFASVSGGRPGGGLGVPRVGEPGEAAGLGELVVLAQAVQVGGSSAWRPRQGRSRWPRTRMGSAAQGVTSGLAGSVGGGGRRRRALRSSSSLLATSRPVPAARIRIDQQLHDRIRPDTPTDGSHPSCGRVESPPKGGAVGSDGRHTASAIPLVAADHVLSRDSRLGVYPLPITGVTGRNRTRSGRSMRANWSEP